MFMMVMTMMLTEFKWCLSAEGQRWGIRAGRAALARLPVFPPFDGVFVVVLRIFCCVNILGQGGPAFFGCFGLL